MNSTTDFEFPVATTGIHAVTRRLLIVPDVSMFWQPGQEGVWRLERIAEIMEWADLTPADSHWDRFVIASPQRQFSEILTPGFHEAWRHWYLTRFQNTWPSFTIQADSQDSVFTPVFEERGCGHHSRFTGEIYTSLTFGGIYQTVNAAWRSIVTDHLEGHAPDWIDDEAIPLTERFARGEVYNSGAWGVVREAVILDRTEDDKLHARQFSIPARHV